MNDHSSPARNLRANHSDSGIDCLAGGGEMGALMRSFDWAATPLGPPAAWPQSLRTAVSICLNSRFPIVLWWGPDLLLLYNDAWRPVLGARHPALARLGREVWPEIWDVIGPMHASVLTTGQATWQDDGLLMLERFGYKEEAYFTYSYSPIRDEAGGVGGVFAAVNETTQRVLSERRLRTLRDLGAQVSQTQTVAEACRTAIRTLAANAYDVPFALLYLLAEGGQEAILMESTWGAVDSPASPCVVVLNRDAEAASSWPLAEVVRSGRMQVVEDVMDRFGPLPGSPWKLPPQQALILPLRAAVQDRLAGFLVAGGNPCRVLDDDYRTFFDLLAGHVANAISNARAYEEERRRAEALAELDRAKTAFFSNVSHEFRTPLTLMLGPVEDILAKPDNAIRPENRELLTVVHRNGQRLLKLVNTLLDFSRIEAGRVQASYEPTDLAAFTAELASVFRSAVERAGLQLIIDCPPLPEPVYVDRDMWEKIVLNLVSNAFKYTLEGEIRVSLRAIPSPLPLSPRGRGASSSPLPSGERGRDEGARSPLPLGERGEGVSGVVELAVHDTGTGIPETELPKLFNRFHRVEGARGRTQEGTGIGLALVQELARLHGGTVRVESVFGQGSTFTVTIPRGKDHLPPDRIAGLRTLASTALGANPFVEEAVRWLPAERQGTAESAAEAVSGTLDRSAREASSERPRVLLADDNADMREYVRRLLAERYEVMAVADGQQALAAARAQRPDLVLTDVMMPHLDGFGLLQALRADPRTRTIPLIMLSARAGEEARVEGLGAGADDYLIKPFSARELSARVAGTLALAHARREALRREEALRTATEEARAEAEAANRMKDQFLATLSHELRTPLNAILGWARILQTGRVDAAGLQDGLETIERNSKVQAQLIDDLLDISRIISGKLRLEVQRVNLVDVIGAALAAIKPAVDAKAIRIQSILDPLAGPVTGDPARLQQVVWNFLSNAVKFTPRNGRIQVLLERVNSHVEISVIDTGLGIKPEFLPYVFDRFRQADASTTRKHGGLGLGLSIVKQLVEMHGGSVRAKSPGEGHGATFTVTLPITVVHEHERAVGPVEPKPPTEEELKTPTVPLEGVRVLVVDDELDARELIKHILARGRAEVRTAGSVVEALALLEKFTPHLLLSDIGMPEQDGYDLIHQVRARGHTAKDLPAVALTAFARPEDRRRALLAGFQMHVAKPVDPDELTAIVASLVGRTGSA